MNAELSQSAAQMFLERNGLPMHDSPLRGHVERLDPALGLQGWVAGAVPDQTPELELRIDGAVFAKCVASIHRPDIWSPSDASVLSGFIFPVHELLALAARSDFGQHAEVRVGPAKTSDYLTADSAWTFSDLQLLLASDAQPDIEIGIGLALPAELRRLALLARRAFSQPARQDSRKRLGVVEFIAPLPGCGFIVGGWMDANAPRTVATVLVAEGRRFAGGFSCVMRSRADLANGMQAFVGILLLDDKPGFQKAPQWSLHLAGTSGRWLSTVQPLRMVEAEVAFLELQQATSASADARGKEIEQFVRDCMPWGTLSMETQGNSVRVGIDDCVVAPGFGVFIRGWVLSAVGELVDLTARFGDALFHLDPSSLGVRNRDDLVVSFPDYGDRLANAGITALLRGAAVPEPQRRWLLRLRFDNGFVHFHEVPLERTRRIDLSYDLSRLQTIYPGFDAAPWLPELVEALYGIRALEQRATVHWWEPATTCKAALVLAISPQRLHQTLALENFDRHVGRLPPGAGAVLMIPASMPPGVVATWMTSIRKRHPGISIDACRLAAGSHPWAALGPVLKHCGVQHFVFIGPGVLLTDAGADEAARLLSSRGEGPVFLAVQTMRAGHPDLVHETSAFGWSTSELREHSANADALVGYTWRDNAIRGGTRVAARSGSAHALHIGGHASPLIESINCRMVSQRMATTPTSATQMLSTDMPGRAERALLINGAAP